jgi:hypothetical protein
MKNFLNNRYDGALSIETNKSLKASIIILTVSILSLLFLNSCKKTEEAVIDETGPFIESVNPAAGYAGTEVTITGRNFGSLKEVDAVTFDGIKATVKFVSSTELKAVAPAHKPGKVSVYVTTYGKKSNAGSFEYLAEIGNVYLQGIGKTNRYKVTSPDETFEYYTKVNSSRDSASGKVFKITAYLPDMVTSQNVFINSSQTVYMMNQTPEILEIIDILKQTEGYVSSTLEGFPLTQTISNNPSLGESVVFKGGPIHFNVKIKNNDPKIPFIINDFKQYYISGKVTGFETVKTPAGTYSDCVKYEYDTKTVSEITPGEKTEYKYHRTVWIKNGIGLVKDIDQSPFGNTVTELIRLE